MPDKPTHKELVNRIQELEQALSDRNGVDRALRESEERFRLAFHTSPDSINLNRVSDGVYIDINDGFTKIMGYSREDVIGKSSLALNIWRNEEDRENLIAALTKTGFVENMEAQFVAKDGSMKVGLMSARTLKINGEDIILSMTRDITDRKQAEEALRESELKYKLLSENSIVGIFIHQGNKYVYVNDTYADMHGYEAEELIGRAPHEFVHPDQREEIKERINRRLKGEQVPKRYEVKKLRKNGTVVWLQTAVSDPITHKGKPAIMGHEIDITARKQTIEALRESEENYRMLFETMIQGIVYQDGEGNIIDANPSAERILGLTLDQMKGRTSIDPRWKSIHEDGSEFSGDTHPAMVALKTGKRIENEIMGVFNPAVENFTWININAVPQFKNEDTKPYQVYTTFQDITEQRQVDKSLKESEERYRSLVELSPEAIFVHQDRLIKYINHTGAKIFGTQDAEDLIGKSVLDLYHPDFHDIIESRIEKAYRDRLTLPTQELKFVRLDGTIIDVEATGICIDYFGQPAILSVIRDITERKQAEGALRKSEEKYRLLFELESDAIMLLRKRDGRILDINNAGALLYGYTREKLLIMKIMELSEEPEETRKALFENIAKIPIRYHRKNDGTVFPVEISGTQILWKGEEARIATVRDISERIETEKEKTELEAKLRQAQKMEAIGTLSGGIAHDFNNILGIMLGNAELAMDDVPEWNPAHANLEEIKKAGLRAKDVIQQLLSFSRKTEYRRKPVKIAPLIKESVKFLRSSIPSSIDIRQDVSIFTDVILGDPTQIHQVMINLCTNSAHAMEEEGGVLEIGLINRHLHENEAKQYPELKPGPYINLFVRDTGCGIDPGIRDRLFDPYFTTKDVGKGTGMGLAVVHGIVKNHVGAISIESEPGRGTTVHVLIPVIEADETETAGQGADTIPTGSERILLVDDEPAIVKMGQQMLERWGYRCEACTRPGEALEFIRSDPDGFDLVITDMTMPQMTGKKLIEEVLKIRPDIPVILCTGYSDKIDEEKTEAMGIRAYAMKPIMMSEFANTVRRVLDQNP